MNLQSIALFLVLSSTSAMASIEFECAGNNSEEFLSFVVDGSEGLEIVALSEGLTKNKTYIDDSEEAIWADLEGEVGSRAKKAKYTANEEHYTIGLTVPRSIANGEGAEGEFKATYVFNYEDENEEKVSVRRTLTCTELER